MLPYLLVAVVVLFAVMAYKSNKPIDIPEGSFLVDVRTPAEFKKGSAPGAINIPLGQILSHIDKFKGKDTIIVFCRTGNRSGQAKSILEEKGIQNIQNGGSWGNVKKSLEKKVKD